MNTTPNTVLRTARGIVRASAAVVESTASGAGAGAPITQVK